MGWVINLRKKWVSLLLLAALICALAGCSSDPTANQFITFEMDEPAENLDPQLAATATELAVAYNCFEGLTRFTGNGELVLGAAASVDESADHLTFTFTLRQDLSWSDGTELTANDFVFGITRALLPETQSPGAENLLSIQNAHDVYSGKMAPSELGVSAVNTDTVVITLAERDDNLFYALAQPAAFPCNQSFFEQTGGKYGLSYKTIISNGPFFVRSWEADQSIQINRSKRYTGDAPAKPSAVLLRFKEDPLTRVARITDGELDGGFLPSDQINSAKNLEITEHFNTMNCIYINPKAKVLGDKAIREALIRSVDRDQVSIVLPSYYQGPGGLVPRAMRFGESSYRQTAGSAVLPTYRPEQAKTTFLDALRKQELDSLPETTLYYPETEDNKLIASYIAQSWQRNLGAYINTKGVSAQELTSLVRNGTVSLALLPLTSQDETAYSFLFQFTANGSFPLGIEKFDALLSGITRYTWDEKAANTLKQAEQMVIDEWVLLPVFSSPVCYAASPTLTGTDLYFGTSIPMFTNLGKKS